MKRTLWAWSLLLGGALGASLFAQDEEQDKAADSPKPEQLFKQLDKNADGVLAADEIGEEQRKFFERVVRVGDDDSDGKLTQKEFVAGLEPDNRPVGVPAGPGGGGQQNQSELFRRLDVNGDGKLARSEVPEPLRPRLDPMFERLGKEEMTQAEFARGANRPGGFQPNPEAMFRRWDTNGDGKVTKDELPEPARERLQPLFDRLGKDELAQEDVTRFLSRGRRDGGGGAGGGDAGPARGNPEQLIEQFDKDKNGKLSKPELPEGLREQLQPVFERLGKDELSAEDLPRGGPGGERRGFGQGGRGFAAQNPEELFNRFDVNKDGKITMDEAPERGRMFVELLFRRAGKKEGESLTKEDLVKLAQASPLGGRAGEEGRPRGPSPSFLQKLDANEDGRLSKDEVAKFSEKFGELDTDNDGQLDTRELMGDPFGGRGPGGFGGGFGGNFGRPDGEGRPGNQAGPDGGRRPDGDRRPEGARPGAGRRGGSPGPRGEGGFATRFFNQFDADKDGQLTKEEAPPRMKEKFSTLDGDGDGSVSREEFQKSLSPSPRGRRDAEPREPANKGPVDRKPEA